MDIKWARAGPTDCRISTGTAPSIVFVAWFRDEFDAGVHHPVVGRIEVVDPGKKPTRPATWLPTTCP